MADNEHLRARARLANLSRRCRADDPAVTTARGDLAVANLEHHVRAALEAAPPLTAEQADRLADILRHASVEIGAGVR